MSEVTRDIDTIAIIGGGQLGRMLTSPAVELGFKVSVLDPVENSPATQVGAHQLVGKLTDTDAIDRLAVNADVLTWEIEHIPAEHLLELLENDINIEPSPSTLLMIQDKLRQKQFLQSVGIPVAPFNNGVSADNFIGGGPYMIKTRRGGFDGRGNLKVDTLDDPRISEVFGDQEVYTEQIVSFEKEIAIIAARDKKGNISKYPAVETIHENNICHIVMSPANIFPDILKQANDIAEATLTHLYGAGIFAIEMFVVDGKVFVNEIAPRVHNSGHLTIEANVTSQFEQHIRAITGMSLGSTALKAPAAVMINILGKKEEDFSLEGLDSVLALPDTHPHFYGKAPRLARKIGHITVLGDSIEEAVITAKKARNSLAI
jgi:5-(carboxyamino)imidazole ribonucleotide synthase